MGKRVLVVAAHPDDEILGIGGTAARLVSEGNDVHCLILGEGYTSRVDNKTDSTDKMLDNLHRNTITASKAVGYSNVFFENLPDNRFDSVDLLTVVKKVEKHISIIKPHTIFTHYYNDLNVDHKVCFSSVLTATRPINDQLPCEIYSFETLSSTEWDFTHAFKPNVFINISRYIKPKLQAMECYTSELRDPPHPRSLEIIRAAAQKWGSVVGVEYAEAFELIRKIL